jgi:hypothetical protein
VGLALKTVKHEGLQRNSSVRRESYYKQSSCLSLRDFSLVTQRFLNEEVVESLCSVTAMVRVGGVSGLGLLRVACSGRLPGLFIFVFVTRGL